MLFALQPSPRLALNMKGIPYRTVWVDFADIPSHCESIGAPPTSHDPIDGTKKKVYTFPVIYDPATNATVSESFNIAKYLDKTYPSYTNASVPAGKSVLFAPAGTTALQVAFEEMWTEKIIANLFPLLAVDIARSGATEKSRDYWRRSREERFGKKIEDLLPPEARPVVWKKALAGFKQVGDWLGVNESGQFVMGETLSWGDVVMGSWLLMIRRMWGEDNDEWKELMSVDGGRWQKFFQAISVWNFVDEEALATLGQWIE